MGNIIDKVKNAYGKVKKGALNIIKSIKFFLTPLGQVIGILILVVFLIIIFYVLQETVKHAFWMWFDDDYAGISTTEDYETIVGSIGYAGYDSLISEEKWQEYIAFEYSVLMDVAEYLYENQDYLTEVTLDGKTYQTSAAFPEGVVKTQYDASDSSITKEKWQEYVVLGQDSKPVSSLGNTNSKYVLGGNRETIPPRLIYEVADNEYEDEAYSLMPYIMIVREDVKLSYFFKGVPDEELENFEAIEGYDSSIIPADILKNHQNDLEAIMYSPTLNKNNPYLPTSTNTESTSSSNESETIKANSGDYGEVPYYVEDAENIVYKIPLRLLINRYLPKATLLTTWYMLKTNDGSENAFDIDGLMADIKEVYNAACYGGTSHGGEIVAEWKIEDDGTITKLDSSIVLRSGAETMESEEVESIQFNELGEIERDESGDAIKGTKEITYATTNNRTFIYFEQFGLETSRFEFIKKYNGSYHTEAENVPIVKDLQSYNESKWNIVKSVSFTVEDSAGSSVTWNLPVSAKTPYGEDVKDVLGLDYFDSIVEVVNAVGNSTTKYIAATKDGNNYKELVQEDYDIYENGGIPNLYTLSRDEINDLYKTAVVNKYGDIDEDSIKVYYYGKNEVPAVYIVEETKLQMSMLIDHKRMPALYVKSCESWAKSTTYTNTIVQNSLDYTDYRYLIPFSNTSLGLHTTSLSESSTYRVSTYIDYFNKSESTATPGIKEADVLNMLVQWEEYANKNGDDTAYAYMRDLYKLVIYIRDLGNEMLESAYSYLYIPTTISNFKDATTQKVFWLERFGVTQGTTLLDDDGLTEDEQSKTRTKGNDIYWQNVAYDEYEECVYDTADGEDARVYALFPYGSSYVRAYYMLAGWDKEDGGIVSNGFTAGSHPAVDMYSRKLLNNILNRSTTVGERIYYYELNRLTIAYSNNGVSDDEAFKMAEEELNSALEDYVSYSPIVSIAPGIVTEVNFNGRSGFYVKVKHYPVDGEAEIESLYVHFKRWPSVEVGDYVGAGTILGYEGTTGKSSGNHLHLQLKIDGKLVDPTDYIIPIFSPFYYREKAEAVLEEDESKALGSEYYSIERTILLDDYLFNKYNKINGKTLADGTSISYSVADKGSLYVSGDKYENTNFSGDVYWGNNVPTLPISESLNEEFMDISLLNQSVAFISGDKGDTDGEKLKNGNDVTSSPKYFDTESEFVENRLKWKDWYTEEMEDYELESN